MSNIKDTNKHFYGLDLLRGISGYGVAICHFYAFIYQAEKAYATKTLMYGFGNASTYYFLDEYKDNPRYKDLVERFREGR